MMTFKQLVKNYEQQGSKHKALQCSVKVDGEQCQDEGRYWIDDSSPETFMLCLDHAVEVSNDDLEIVDVDTNTGEITHSMLGGYCCSKDCKEDEDEEDLCEVCHGDIG